MTQEKENALVEQVAQLTRRVDELRERVVSTEAETRALLAELKNDIASLVKLLRGNGRMGIHDEVIMLRGDLQHIERRLESVETARVRESGFNRSLAISIVGWIIAAAAVMVAVMK